MKTNLFVKFTALSVLSLFLLALNCNPEPPAEPDVCDHTGIYYKLDGSTVSFDDAQITGEIFHDAAIGKFYDIWTDENGGFYFHSTITEDGETGPFSNNWFVTQDVANITFLNSMQNVNMQFEVVEGASAVGDRVVIKFSGTYEDSNNTTHTITDGLICTDIDVVH